MAHDANGLGRVLCEKFGLTRDQIEEAARLRKEKGGTLGDALIRLGYAREEQVLQALGLALDLPTMDRLGPENIDPALVMRVPLAFAKKHGLLPLTEEEGAVRVAASDPFQVSALDDLRLLLGRPLRLVIAPSRVIMELIHRVYDRAGQSAKEVIEDLGGESLDALAEGLTERQDLLDATEEAPIIRLVNSVLYQAVKDRASDIHLEPFERELVIRYRIDGVLINVLKTPRRVQAAVISRIKIMAGLDIAEKRHPQDGRIGLKIAGREVDVRVSVIPIAHGERVVLRLLDKSQRLLDLNEIGLSERDRATVERLIRLSHGILLVAGPTGSGKTTTLYACLSRINSPDKNIITIEDPIEYQLKGIGQMQVNPKIDLTFAGGLRSILRQDPDIIMVGEIRDVETASIAIHASLTGHLVFSTIHTNDAAGGITRLVDMGIEPFLVSSSLVAIAAQRLVRTLCTSCRKPYSPSAEELAKLGLPAAARTGPFYRAVGCPACKDAGYLGRIGIYEFLLMDDDLRQLVLGQKDSNTIKEAARAKGMRVLRDDGAAKVRAGLTTTEEILRVTQEDAVGP